MTTTEFQVTGMTCAHCEAAVRQEVSKVSGVDAIEVDATSGSLRVSSAASVDADAVLAAVDEAGYQAAPA